jgi:hypothetical protein
MDGKIKVKLSHGFKGECLDKDFFPIKVLRENFKVEFVDLLDEADVIFEMAGRETDYSFLKKKNKKLVLISSEDLFFKKNLFSFIESFLHKILKDKKYIAMDKLDLIIPKIISSFPIIYFFPKHLKFLKGISKRKVRNSYAIIQNEILGKNIFIIPYFLNLFYYKISSLIKKSVISDKELKKKKFCAFIVSSNSSRERVDFFKRLSKYKKIDSYGRVRNNMGEQIFKNSWHTSHYKILKNYKFVICFENNFSKEYITEKLPNAMFSGAIPIYRGAPNVGDYFNTKSFINYEDYGSYEKMIEKIIELDKYDNKYKEFIRLPWFKENKIPKRIKNKEKELIEFYKRILGDL